MSQSLSDKHPILNWFINNPVTTNLMMIGILLGGLYMVGFFGLKGMVAKLPLEAFPLLETNVVTISASLNGSNPEDVEQGVTNKIEDALQGINGVDEIVSRTTANLSQVNVSAIPDYDIDELMDNIKTTVDTISDLPAEVEKVLVSKNQRQQSILWVTLSGDMPENILIAQANRLKRVLLKNPFVERTEISGEKDREIAIEISSDILQEYGLSLAQVTRAIDNGSIDLSAGNLETTQGKVSLRIKNQAYEADDYASIVIRSEPEGTLLTVGDIATISDGFVERKSISEFNGEPSITLKLFSGKNANVIEADKAATSVVKEFIPSLPDMMQATIWNNRVDMVRDRINLFVKNAALGVVLVFLLLTLFLNVKLAFWVALGIPVSFSGALIAMNMMDISINMITLFGFIIVLGIVVDDAIVIGESIYTSKKRTKNAPNATIIGVSRVSTAATFGVLTTVAAFLPLTQIAGGMGDILGQIGWVVIFCLLFSLVESKLILPSHLHNNRVALREESHKGLWTKVQSAIAHGLETLVEKMYLPVLTAALRHRYFTVLIFISLFVLAVGTVKGGILKYARFPNVESQYISLTVSMDSSVDVETTIKWAEKAALALRKVDEKIMQESGQQTANVTNISVNNSSDIKFKVSAGLSSAETRTLAAQKIANRWRKELGQIAGAKTVSYAARRRFSRSDIDIQVLGDNLDDVQGQQMAVEHIMKNLKMIPGVKDVSNSEENVSKEIRINMRAEAEIYGISRSELAQTIRTAFYGIQAERIQRDGEEVRVMIRYPKDERQSLADLENFLVPTSTGKFIPISEVADLTFSSSPKSIMHLNQQRVISVYADVERNKISSDEVIELLQEKNIFQNLENQYDVDIEMGGEAKEGKKSDKSMIVGFISSLLMIYVLLAIPLKSYTKPLIIMSVIPFGIIGAIGGHLILGMKLTMIGMFGVIALSGVVVNDSLLLVSAIQQYRDEGLGVFQSIQRTGVRRFRPIILTSITTFAGLIPMLFETSFQAQFLIPMAVSLGFGILFATTITLVLVPVLYYIFNDIKNVFFVEIHSLTKS